MADLPTTSQAIDILTRAVLGNAQRLEHGLKLREEMHEQIARGEKPTGYRAEWIRSAALRVVDCLQECSVEFNEMFSDDRISTEDLLDVIATVRNLFNAKI